jgi:tetratricopeptide (TPR) repeat protein
LEAGYLKAAIDQLTRYQQLIGQLRPQAAQHPELARLLRGEPWRVAEQIGRSYSLLGRHVRAAQAYRHALEQTDRQRELWADYIRALARAGQPDQAADEALSLLCEYPDEEAVELAVWTYQQVGRPTELIANLQARVAQRPEQPELAMVLADLLDQQGQLQQMTDTLRQVLRHTPRFTEAYWQLARALVRANRETEAVAVAADAVRATPDAYAEAEGILAELFGPSPSGTLREALADMRRTKPDDFATHYVVGLVQQIGGAWMDAEAALRRSVDLAPDQPGPYLALARLFLHQCRWLAAVDLCRSALAQGHRLGGIYVSLARAFDGLDQFDEAQSHYQLALEENPRQTRVLRALAELYLRHGMRAQAERQYLAILSIDSHDEQAREALLRSFVERNELFGAQRELAVFAQIGAKEPVPSRCAALLAFQVHRDRRKYQQALTAILHEYPDDIETRYRLAESLVGARRYESAFEHVGRILQADPAHHGAREILVSIYAAWMDYMLALDVLESLLVEHPNRPEWLAARARICSADRQYEQAVETLQRLLPLIPPAAAENYRLMLTDVYRLAGRGEEAERLLLENLDDSSLDRAAVTRLLDLWRTQDKFDKAVEFLQSQLRDNPDDELLRRQLVTTYNEASRYELAECQLLRWLEQDPDDFGLDVELVTTLLLAGRSDEAIELSRNLAHDGSEALDRRWLLVRTYSLARQPERAVAELRALMQEAPGGRLDEELIRLLIAAQQYDEAVDRARQIIDDEPRLRPAMLRLLSAAYQHAGRTDLAEQYLVELHEIDPYDPTIANDLGYTWADAGRNLDQAEEMIRFALGERPREAAYLDSIGWLLYKKGQVDAALEYLQQAAEPPDGLDAVIYDHLGDAAYRAGLRDLARQSWQRALELSRRRPPGPIRPEDRRVEDSARQKLAELDAGGRPQIAPLGGDLERPGD